MFACRRRPGANSAFPPPWNRLDLFKPLKLSCFCHSPVMTSVMPGHYSKPMNQEIAIKGIRDFDAKAALRPPVLSDAMVDRSEKGGTEMLQMQNRQVLAPEADRLVREWPVPTRDLMQLEMAFTGVLPEQESHSEILRVLDRAAEDNGLIAELTHRGSKALEGYKLTLKAKAALLSGDIRWIEARLGKLNARLRTWLDCRLQQEIW